MDIERAIAASLSGVATEGEVLMKQRVSMNFHAGFRNFELTSKNCRNFILHHFIMNFGDYSESICLRIPEISPVSAFGFGTFHHFTESRQMGKMPIGAHSRRCGECKVNIIHQSNSH